MQKIVGKSRLDTIAQSLCHVKNITCKFGDIQAINENILPKEPLRSSPYQLMGFYQVLGKC